MHNRSSNYFINSILISVVFLFILCNACNKIDVQNKNEHIINLLSNDSNNTNIKPQIGGLLIRHFNEWIAYHTINDADSLKYTPGFVVDVNWSDLQSYKNAPINPNIIDTAISFVQQVNAMYPDLNLHLKIRLYCGCFSPAWVINSNPLFHKPGVGYENTPQSDTIMACWWKKDFLKDFKDLEKKLAAKYDTVKVLEEVTTSACGTFSAETIVHQFSGQTTGSNSKNNAVYLYNIQHALAAGFTNNADINAQKTSMDAMHAWKHTRVEFIFDSYEYINSDTTVTLRNDISKQLIDYFITSFGKQAVLGNNSIRQSTDSAYLPGGITYDLFEYMSDYRKNNNIPLTFQTALIDRVGNLPATIQECINFNAGCVELPDGFDTVLVKSQIKKYDQKLIKQAIK